MIYRKIKRTWSHNSANYIPNFRKVFPELSAVNDEDLANRFIDLKMDFYCERKHPVNILVRFTLPIAFLLIILMFISLPIVFLITGNWGYSLGKNNYILNWFRSLKIQ